MKTYKQNLYKSFRALLSKNFELPCHCRNTHQIQFYMRELQSYIQYYRHTFEYVPNIAFYLMREYKKVMSINQKKEYLMNV